MIAEQQARRMISRVVAKLMSAYGSPEPPAEEDLLRRVIRVILKDGASDRVVDSAVRRLEKTFVDWNEARVSTVHQIADAISDTGDPETKARSLRAMLQAIFRKQCAGADDFLQEGGAAEVRNFMETVPEMDLAIRQKVLLLALGCACVPVTTEVVRVSVRLDLVRADYDAWQIGRRLERVVPKSGMPDFYHAFSLHAAQTCLEDRPKCKLCEVIRDCAFHRSS